MCVELGSELTLVNEETLQAAITVVSLLSLGGGVGWVPTSPFVTQTHSVSLAGSKLTM